MTKRRQVLEWLIEVGDFSLEGSNPDDRRNDLLNRLESHYEELSRLAPVVDSLFLKPGPAEEAETAAREKLEDIDRSALDLTVRQQHIVEETRAETGRIVEEARSALKDTQSIAAAETARQQHIAEETRAETRHIAEEALSETGRIAEEARAETRHIAEEARSALKDTQSIAAAETARQQHIAEEALSVLKDIQATAAAETARQQHIAEEALSETGRIAEEARAETRHIAEEARSVLESIQDIAAEAGVGQQSTVFGDQATNDSSTSEKWLVRACIAGGGSLIAVCAVIFWPLSAETTSEAVRAFGGRLAILTFFAFVLGFTVRQYTSSKHNETVNLHRANALRTFTTFVGAASDQEMKDAVLLEATRAIFAPQPSGFLRAGHETESPSTIIEVIRRISSGTTNKP